MPEFNWNEMEVEGQNNGFDWNEFESETPASYTDTAKRIGSNALAGYAQWGQDLWNLPHNIAGLFSKEFAEKIPHMEDVNYAQALGQNKTETSDVLTQKLFEYAPSLFLPAAHLGKAGKAIESIPAAGKYIERGLATALPQMGYTYAAELENNPEEALEAAGLTGAITAPFGVAGQAVRSSSPAMRAAGATGAALGGGALGYMGAEALDLPSWATLPAAAATGLLTERGIRPQSYAKNKVFEDMSPEQVKEVVEASERLGLSYVTPAEAAGTQFAGETQASIGKTAQGSKIKYEKGMERLKSEEKSIVSFLDNIYSGPELTPEKQALYSSVMQEKIPTDFAASMAMNNEIIGSAISKLESNPVYRESLKGVAPDSFQYWDQVKRIIDDMQQTALRNGERNQAKIIGDTKYQLIDQMDSINPDYKKARSLAEREFTREGLEKTFDKKPITGRNFYKALESETKFNKLRKSLSEFPGLQSQLDDMRLVFPRLINPQNAKTGHALEATSMNKTRGGVKQDLDDLIARTIGRRADVEAANLITNPKWFDQFKKYSADKQKSDSLLAYIVETLGKGAGHAEAVTNENRGK